MSGINMEVKYNKDIKNRKTIPMRLRASTAGRLSGECGGYGIPLHQDWWARRYATYSVKKVSSG